MKTWQLNSFFLKKILLPLIFFFVLFFIVLSKYDSSQDNDLDGFKNQLQFILSSDESFNYNQIDLVFNFLEKNKKLIQHDKKKNIDNLKKNINLNKFFENEVDPLKVIQDKEKNFNIESLYHKNKEEFYIKFSKYKEEITLLKSINNKKNKIKKLKEELLGNLFEIKNDSFVKNNNVYFFYIFITFFSFFLVYLFNLKRSLKKSFSSFFFDIINNKSRLYFENDQKKWEVVQKNVFLKKNISEFFIENFKWPFFVIGENQEILFFNKLCYQNIFSFQNVSSLQDFFKLNFIDNFYFYKKKYITTSKEYPVMEIYTHNKLTMFTFFSQDYLKEITLEKDKIFAKDLLKVLRQIQFNKKISAPEYYDASILDVLENLKKNIAFSEKHQEKILQITEKNKFLLKQFEHHLISFKTSIKELKITTSFEHSFEFSIKEFLKKNQEFFNFFKLSFESPVSLSKQIESSFKEFLELKNGNFNDKTRLIVCLSKMEVTFKQQLRILQAKNFDEKFAQNAEHLNKMEKLLHILADSRKRKEDLFFQFEQSLLRLNQEISLYEKKQAINNEVLNSQIL